VKIHLHNIISKLGARNRTEAAAIYRRTGREVALH
jgi:DNA-binding NarL/FixJ family response regulator